MSLDTRAFILLKTPSGQTVKCRPPRVNALAQGIGASMGPVTSTAATHTITVYTLDGPLPTDLVDGQTVTVDGRTYVVLPNGVGFRPFGAVLYVRANRPSVRA